MQPDQQEKTIVFKRKKRPAPRNIFFDIETSPQPEAELMKKFEPTFTPDAKLSSEPDKRLKDPEKIAADIEEKKAKIAANVEEKRAKWISESALHAERAEILAIGYAIEDEPTIILHGNEGELLTQFDDVLMRINIDKLTLCGFNCKGFDLPMIRRRHMLLRLPFIHFNHTDKWNPWRFQVFDALENWQSGNRQEYISLDNLARALGVGRKTGNGADFATEYRNNPEKALEYLKNDVDLHRSVCRAAIGIY